MGARTRDGCQSVHAELHVVLAAVEVVDNHDVVPARRQVQRLRPAAVAVAACKPSQLWQ